MIEYCIVHKINVFKAFANELAQSIVVTLSKVKDEACTALID